MSTDLEKEHYDRALNALGLRRDKNPFPLDPPRSVDYWADNKEVLQKMIKANLDSIMFASSFIYILYGPVGGGKTFAVKYLANPRTRKMISRKIQKPDINSFNIRVAAIVPLRSGQLTFSLHKDIVEKCFSAIVRNQKLLEIFARSNDFGVGNIRRAFQNIKTNIHRSFEGKLAIANIENNEGYKFLTQTRSRYGKLKDVNELVETIRILILILSKEYRRVVISVDELENLVRSTGTERFLISDFFRKLHEMIEYDMTLFLVFTLDSFEEIASLLQPAMLSRVKERIEFPFVKDSAAVREYIAECISQRCNVNPYEVVSEDVISEIADSLISNFRGRLSFRNINKEMHRIFISTYISANQPNQYRIDLTLYEKAMKVPSPAEVMRHLTEKTAEGEEK